MITIAINGFSTPIALKWASTGSGQVEGEIAVVFHPDLAIGVYVCQIPGRQGKGIQITHHRPGGSTEHFAQVPESNSEQEGEISLLIKLMRHIFPRYYTFPTEDIINTLH